MSWFVFALVATLAWGFADLFYKLGTNSKDGLSHLKISVWVGLVMGVSSFILMPLSETGITLSSLPMLFVRYAPASLPYIASMVVGYIGLRYIELSIVSPIQNASGALSTIALLIFFMLSGEISRAKYEFSKLNIIGTVLIVVGVIALAVVEQVLSDRERALPKEDRKYRYGALALLLPIIYCIFDTVGTAADGILLDGEHGLVIGEIDVIIVYGLTFFLFGIGCWLWMAIFSKEIYNPFKSSEHYKAAAAACEEFGQFFYVYAMARKPMIAAPMIASYCIVSVVLSRLFLKEKLKLSQYACVILVMAGIVLLGISEGLSEI